jgi:predicted deacylase
MAHSIDHIPVTTLVNGGELALTVHTFGSGSGPVVGISAAIHGDETVGVEVLRRLAEYLDERADHINGTVRLLPVGNPLAYEANTRETPLDHQNLNRVFPGDPDGWLTEQLADKINHHFLRGLNAYVDLHAGGAYPVVDYVYMTSGPNLSRAFGSRLLYRPSHPYEGTTGTVTSAEGIPTVTVELGGGLYQEEQYAERILSGLINILRLMNVIPGEVTPAPEQLLLHELAILRPHYGGILVPEVRVPALGTEVQGGTVLGRIYSPYTFELLETITAPFERSVLVLLRDNLAPISPGSYMYMIGNGESAEILPSSSLKEQ